MHYYTTSVIATSKSLPHMTKELRIVNETVQVSVIFEAYDFGLKN